VESLNIREIVEKILTDLVPGINLLSDSLMEEEGVQSLTMIRLISELDEAFNIEITFADIEENSFHSVDAIENMVKNHLV